MLLNTATNGMCRSCGDKEYDEPVYHFICVCSKLSDIKLTTLHAPSWYKFLSVGWYIFDIPNWVWVQTTTYLFIYIALIVFFLYYILQSEEMRLLKTQFFIINFVFQVAARFCEGGHICSLPRECCTQGCCPPYQSGPRQLPPPSEHVLNLFFISHWFFWYVRICNTIL